MDNKTKNEDVSKEFLEINKYLHGFAKEMGSMVQESVWDGKFYFEKLKDNEIQKETSSGRSSSMEG